jgi:superoxide reductase
MTTQKQIYKCAVCGNIVEVLHTGAGTLVCCGQEMQLQAENTIEASLEKHVPVIEKTEKGVIVKVGSVAHPMEDAHYIEWIEIQTASKSGKKFLKPEDKPEAEFYTSEEILFARAYCNLHGLWKS